MCPITADCPSIPIFVYQGYDSLFSSPIVSRIDVQGADSVIDKYRAHYAFISDCLDAFIVGACLHYLELEDLQSTPKRQQALFDILPTDQKYSYIHEIATDILKRYVNLNREMPNLEESLTMLDWQAQQIQAMYDHTTAKYTCVQCNKQYKTVGYLKKHLVREHGWQVVQNVQGDGNTDRIAQYRASFMKTALLLRDTNNAYCMGDGDRIMDNSKFQMLISGIGHHTKYQLWLFRFLAYYHVLLNPRAAYEYKWNCTTNLHGGLGHNIPNDNLVEILVHRLKEKLRAQGANVTYDSAKKAALTLQIQEEIKNNMMNQCAVVKKSTKRTHESQNVDVVLMVTALLNVNVFDNIPGRHYEHFRNFRDLFSCVKVTELHKWLTHQKERLSYETI